MVSQAMGSSIRTAYSREFACLLFRRDNAYARATSSFWYSVPCACIWIGVMAAYSLFTFNFKLYAESVGSLLLGQSQPGVANLSHLDSIDFLDECSDGICTCLYRRFQK